MSELVTTFESLSKAVAFVSATVAVIGLFIEYRVKIQTERRLQNLAVLETDIKISTLFSELVSVANGYGSWSEPQSRLIEEILQAVPNEVKDQILISRPTTLGQVVSGARIPTPVPFSQQLAASESIASLAIRYEFLIHLALIGLDVLVGFLPQAKSAYDRLCAHYKINRPLTSWDFSGHYTAESHSVSLGGETS